MVEGPRVFRKSSFIPETEKRQMEFDLLPVNQDGGEQKHGFHLASQNLNFLFFKKRLKAEIFYSKIFSNKSSNIFFISAIKLI